MVCYILLLLFSFVWLVFWSFSGIFCEYVALAKCWHFHFFSVNKITDFILIFLYIFVLKIPFLVSNVLPVLFFPVID